MGKHLLAGAAGLLLIAATASAQTYPPATTPPEIPAPNMGIPAPGTSTTTIAPGEKGGYRSMIARYGLDAYGNPVTLRSIYREGLAGSSLASRSATTDTAAGGAKSGTSQTAGER